MHIIQNKIFEKRDKELIKLTYSKRVLYKFEEKILYFTNRVKPSKLNI